MKVKHLFILAGAVLLFFAFRPGARRRWGSYVDGLYWAAVGGYVATLAARAAGSGDG